jgi:hypothetical protein
MLIDELDIFILNKIYAGETGTTNLARDYYKIYPEKEIFQMSKKIKSRELRARALTIKFRLKKMKEWGLIEIEKEEGKGGYKNVYVLIDEKIKIGKHKFPDGYCKNTFCLNIKNKWCAFEV